MCPMCGPVSAKEWIGCDVSGCHPTETGIWLGWQKATSEASEAPDPIASPPHYRSHPSGVEALTITEHHSFCLGNTLKYLWRAGQKEGEDLQKDLAKAWFYLTRECHRLGVDLPDIEAITSIPGTPPKP